MSSFIFIGFFGLEGGQRVRYPRLSDPSSGVFHNVYSTAIQLPDDADPSFIPADLRVWSPRAGDILCDNTVAFVVAKAYVPDAAGANNTPDKALLDAIYLVPCPGDPSLPDYEEHIPDFPVPLVFALGSVSGAHTSLETGDIAFPLMGSEYVRDSVKQSKILASSSPGGLITMSQMPEVPQSPTAPSVSTPSTQTSLHSTAIPSAPVALAGAPIVTAGLTPGSLATGMVAPLLEDYLCFQAQFAAGLGTQSGVPVAGPSTVPLLQDSAELDDTDSGPVSDVAVGKRKRTPRTKQS
ncbi:hypothetical protein HWV62_13601 [Athelia sp. TMB]|nr:hypothetical protein HWV62_13601 [Athelia sp. TMB]